MSFAGKVWRLLVGIKDALALIFLILFFYAIFAVLSGRPSPAQIREGALFLQLDGSVVEEPSIPDPLSMVLSSAVPTREYAVRDLVRSIDEAAKDKRIKALALDLTTFTGGGYVHMSELASALDRFRAAEKPVLTYSVAYTDDSLLLAAHSSEVWVDPMGGAMISGPGGENIYYAGLLERLKVKARVYRVGTYKSAVEPYILNEMSPEARENAEALYGSLWEEWKANVKQARPKADIDRVTRDIGPWIEESKGDLAQAALSAGLVDKVGDWVAWGTRVAEVAGSDDWSEEPGAFAKTDYDPWLTEIAPDSNGDAIGVITIAGEISDGNAGPGEAGAERIVELLDDALNDDLKALVVRVNSPGGTVTGSEAIRRAIMRHKAKGIPIAVSMGNYAASGGYWVSTPADRIFAEPQTITGSIGIFGVVPTFEDALAEWGVTTDGVRTTPLSGQPDIAAGFTPEADLVLQKTIEFGYSRFLALVAESRGLPVERVDELGQGRVWDGGSARQLGLVDQFGDLDAALDWAAAEAGLEQDKWHAKFLIAQPTGVDAFLANALGGNQTARAPRVTDTFSWFAMSERDSLTRVASDLEGLLKAQGLQARCLECRPDRPARQPPVSEGSILAAIARQLLD